MSFNIKFFKDRDGFVIYQIQGFITILNKKITETPIIIETTAFGINFAFFILRYFNN